MTRVLAVASEIFPLVKTGGLADVVGALPSALAAEGVQTTTAVPGYPAVMRAITKGVVVHHIADLFGGPADVVRGTASGLDLMAVDAPHLFGRTGSPYFGPDGREWTDNDLRFAGLSAAAATMAVDGDFDVVHAHDWQAALSAVYLHVHPGRRPGTVLTIHNLAFQGMFPASLFPRLGLPADIFGINGLEFYGLVNFLKGGLVFADRLTTVSPTYAREITQPEHGAALDGVLRERSAVLTGILNGIDDTVWNPATDRLIEAPFSSDSLTDRLANKLDLQQHLGLEEQPDSLLIGVVSRLTHQKGLDLLLDAVDRLVALGIQLAVLGAGDPALEQEFTAAAEWHAGQVACVVGYDEGLAHRMQAGCDALLVASRFEPCGLTQLYALRYGAVPIVSRVGGLADTVIDANEAALASRVATGLQFAPVTTSALIGALERAEHLWRDRDAWQRMQVNGMRADVSWRRSARQYAALFKALEAERS